MSMFIRIPQDSICIVFLQNSWTVTYYYDTGKYWDYVDIGIPDCEMIALEQIIPILYGQSIIYPKKSIVQEMALLVRDSGSKAAIQKVNELKNDTLYKLDYIELAGLGEILNDWYQMPDESLQLLEYAINEFPESFFVYEKYADILSKNKKTILAREYYNKAIDIFEQNPEMNEKFKKKYELLKDKMEKNGI
jgi:tetratricopeptide (TPR) repeat protein